MGFFFDGFEQIFFVAFFLVFALVFGIIIFTVVKGVRVWNQNNNSPRLTVQAQCVSKRVSVSSQMHSSNSQMHHGSSTWYYATFQVESGDRMEFSVNGREYGMLAEGDVGRLTFQGTRYLSFQRQ